MTGSCQAEIHVVSRLERKSSADANGRFDRRQSDRRVVGKSLVGRYSLLSLVRGIAQVSAHLVKTPLPAASVSTDEIELSIVMPCLNEARTVAGCIAEAQAALARAGLAGEIIVADNGSSDGSRELAVTAGARVVAVEERGYGSALRAGIAAARGRFVLMGDADASYDFGHLERFVASLRAGNELVIGNRFSGGVAPGAMPWKNRYLGNPVLSFFGRLFFGGAIGDFHCGLRAFTADAVRRLDLRTSGMEFATEMIAKARLHRLRVAEVPTILRPDGRGRPPHLRAWRDGWRHLRFMLLLCPRWLFLVPGLVLILAGGGLGVRLVGGPLVLPGPVTLDVHTLFFCAIAVIVGFQALAFALLSETFARHFGLRPVGSRLLRGLRLVTLETGVAGGVLCAVSGVALSAWSWWYWRGLGFGDLDPRHVLRWVIPGGTLMAVGCQIVLVSFFLGVLHLGVRDDPDGRRS